MKSFPFKLSQQQFDRIKRNYPNTGKNSHIGHSAEMIVKFYFESNYVDVTFPHGVDGADITITYDGKTENFEIKGTADSNISWSKLKVSSKACHDALVSGMTMIRVTNIGQKNVELHFLKYGEDFTLVPEDRWAIKRIK